MRRTAQYRTAARAETGRIMSAGAQFMCEKGRFMRRIALRFEGDARELVEPEGIFCVEARGADSGCGIGEHVRMCADSTSWRGFSLLTVRFASGKRRDGWSI